jgi:hypothetical protein
MYNISRSVSLIKTLIFAKKIQLHLRHAAKKFAELRENHGLLYPFIIRYTP